MKISNEDKLPFMEHLIDRFMEDGNLFVKGRSRVVFVCPYANRFFASKIYGSSTDFIRENFPELYKLRDYKGRGYKPFIWFLNDESALLALLSCTMFYSQE